MPSQQMRDSMNSLMRRVTRDYIASLDPDAWPDAEEFEQGLMAEVLSEVMARNATAPKKDLWNAPQEMLPAMVAMALMARHHFARIDFSDGEEQELSAFPLHYYDEESGLYKECETDVLGKMVRGYRFSANLAFVENVHTVLREEAPIRTRTRDANLDVVRNGIRNRRTGELMPFTHEMVFTTKTAVDWVDDPPMPVCTSDDGWEWNIEEALLEMAGGDAEVAEFLWDVVMASARPNVRWDKSFWFYSKTGNNGKGTLCQLIRNMLGAGNHTSIPFADFNNNHFMLGALPRVQAVICDENQVGKYADDNAEFKAAVTNDVFRIDRKHKPPISARFYGSIIECVNEIPRIRDRSDSFWRRVVTVFFPACFTGRERPEVKHDFIARQDVLEYVQWRALSKDCDTLHVPAKCEAMLEEFKAESNPVLQFASEVLPRAKWDLLPWSFLWDLYRPWYEAAYNKSGAGFGRNKFFDELGSVVDSHPELGWCHDRIPGAKQGRKWDSSLMDGPEPMIVEYGLDLPKSEWGPGPYHGVDADRRATPVNLKDKYRGLVRIAGVDGAGGGLSEDEEVSDV